MRNTVVLVAAAAVVVGGAALAIPVAAAATPSPRRDVVITPPPGAVEQRYGIVRYDTGAHRWTVLSTTLFQSAGLTGVSCSAATGKLTVGFDPLGTIGTFTVDEDESYAGRYDAGASVTADAMIITIRKPSTGAVVSCADGQLQIANSNLQVLVIGTVTSPTTLPTTPPTTKPTTKPPTQPTTPPTSSSPTPPTSSQPTPPPDFPTDPTDPADS